MFQGDGDGGFSAGGEAGQPDGEAMLAAEGGAFAGGDVGGVEGYVAVQGGRLVVGGLRLMGGFTHVAMVGFSGVG